MFVIKARLGSFVHTLTVAGWSTSDHYAAIFATLDDAQSTRDTVTKSPYGRMFDTTWIEDLEGN